VPALGLGAGEPAGVPGADAGAAVVAVPGMDLGGRGVRELAEIVQATASELLKDSEKDPASVPAPASTPAPAAALAAAAAPAAAPAAPSAPTPAFSSAPAPPREAPAPRDSPRHTPWSPPQCLLRRLGL